MSTIRDQVVELADVPGGVSNKELQAVFDLSPRHVNMHMTALVNQGRVHPAKRAGDRIRWFKRVAVRDAWMLEMQRGETMYTVVPKAKRACDKPTRQGPKLVDVHEHLPSRARKPGAKCPPLQGSEMERPLPTAGVTIDPHWHLRTGEQIVGVETVRSLGLSDGHDPRYQCGPDEQVPAIFSGRKYGEYTEPASTWAKAAMRGAA